MFGGVVGEQMNTAHANAKSEQTPEEVSVSDGRRPSGFQD